MKELKISGHSDDIIVLEGAINNELCPASKDMDDDGVLLAISDGTVLQVKYESDGIWRLGLVRRGSASYHNDEIAANDEDRYSDVVTLRGEALTWVVMGTVIAH